SEPKSARTVLRSFYEGDRDGNGSSPLYDSVLLGALPDGTKDGEAATDDGRKHAPGATIRFAVTVDPANEGVVLRRRLDQQTFGQAADVSVDGAPAGVWLTAGANELKRWADADFLLPP